MRRELKRFEIPKTEKEAQSFQSSETTKHKDLGLKPLELREQLKKKVPGKKDEIFFPTLQLLINLF